MSDLMLLGVLRMPMTPERLAEDPLAAAQFIDRAREAADRIEADAEVIASLRASLVDSAAELDRVRETVAELAAVVGTMAQAMAEPAGGPAQERPTEC